MTFPLHKPGQDTAESLNVSLFKEMIQKIRIGNKDFKIENIAGLLKFDGLVIHHRDKNTKRLIVAECRTFEYAHEQHTAKKITSVDYDVLFVPKGYFKREEKKYDVFLLRNHIILEADLKCIASINPDTIGKRIKEGSEQAKTIILDIHSAINKRDIIIGLKTGCTKNDFIKEILLFYNSRFYRLRKSQIMGKAIFDIIN
jgi:hypothetical protein